LNNKESEHQRNQKAKSAKATNRRERREIQQHVEIKRRLIEIPHAVSGSNMVNQ
jgi:hypothetical protein